MLKLAYIFGAIDGSNELNPAKLTGDLNTDLQSDYLRSLVSGRVATVKNGYVELAEDGDVDAGFIVHDAVSQYGTNQASVATGKLAIVMGGGVAETDQVVETDIKAGDLLYIGKDNNKGLLTKNKPSNNSVAVAVARSANSATDKTVKIRFFI